jgi:hypothetical protein
MSRIRKEVLRSGPVHERRHPLDNGSVRITTFVPLLIRKRGNRKVVVPPAGVTDPIVAAPAPSLPVLPFNDTTLVKALALALYWQAQLDAGNVADSAEIARREKMDRTRVSEILRLTLLAPDIAQRILEGRQPKTLTLEILVRAKLPLAWEAQREMLKAAG